MPPDFQDAMQPGRAVILRNVVSLEESVFRNTLTFLFFFFFLSMEVRSSKKSNIPSKCGEPLV